MVQGKMTVTDDEIIEILRDSGDPAYITSEVAEMLDMSAEGTRNRLQDLHDEGRLCKKKPNRQSTMWWLPSFSSRQSSRRSTRNQLE
jgi:predicted ArsR family transcriptional regulator